MGGDIDMEQGAEARGRGGGRGDIEPSGWRGPPLRWDLEHKLQGGDHYQTCISEQLPGCSWRRC